MARGSLLVIEWSPTSVRAFDPATGRSSTGATIAACLGESGRGREAVIGVSRRSAFVRSTYVPNANRGEIEGILRMQLEGVLPFAPNEYVLGLRMGAFVEGKGRLAAVGAIKNDGLQKIADDARAAGLNVRAILPVAYGSWVAARNRSLADCAVVEAQGDALNIDIVKDGELHYSRSVPLPETAEDIEDEIARTFAVAEVPALPILAASPLDIEAEYRDAQETISWLADPASLARLFSFESPHKREAKLVSVAKWRSRRALVTVALAAGLAGYGYSVRQKNLPKPDAEASRLKSTLQAARKEQSANQERFDRLDRAKRILDVAFEPSQTMADIVTVLANSATAESWFTGLSIVRGAPMSISGLAVHDKDVTTFLDALSNDPRFSGMKVISTNRTAIADTPLTQFNITGNAVGTLPFDHPLKKEKKPVGKAKP